MSTTEQSYRFYLTGSAGAAQTDASFLDLATGAQFKSYSVVIYNDGADLLDFSFDKFVNLDGTLKAGEKIEFLGRIEQEISVRQGGAAAVAYRLWAW